MRIPGAGLASEALRRSGRVLRPVTQPVESVAAGALRASGRVLYPAVRTISAPVLRRAFQLHPEGVEHVPASGPAILTPNHLSFLDPFFVVMSVDRRITFIGKAEYIDSWTTRWFVELGGGIPVRREDGAQAQTSLAAGESVLESGELVGVFPEGTRSPHGRLYKGKTGAARMALEVGCPIIPVGIRGAGEVLPKEAKIPKVTRVDVHFGRPMSVPEEAREDRGVLRSFTDELMQAIGSLSGQTYRHRYAYNKKVGQVPAPMDVGWHG
jgi:1-acyl-sn-glycerol-3-phosphate acyltransferase